MTPHDPTPEEIEAFAAGELSPEAAERVLEAVVRSERVAAELEECLQLRALGAEAGAAATPRVEPRDELQARRERKRSKAWIGVLVVAAAAAAIAFFVARGGDEARRDRGVQLALAPTRGVVGRVSWAAADAHRPYDVARASGAPGREALSLDTLAQIERMGDARALAAAHLLAGDVARAKAALDAAPAGADTDSDRAALALALDDPEQALVHAAAALARVPAHPQARWNRAAALERLSLEATAAAAYEEIAAAGEPGWADEAASRAELLRARRQRIDQASADADKAGVAMVAGGEPPLALVAAFPDRMRLYLYDAIRTAPSADRVRALRPMAEALDAAFGESTLVALVDRVAAADFGKRAALAQRYAAVQASRTPAEARALVDAAATLAPDIALGALLYTGTTPGVIDATEQDRYATLAAASVDPWFALAAEEQRASLLLYADDASAAETVLAAARARCAGTKLVLRCERIGRLLAHAYLALQRIAPARALLDELLRSARATSNPALEGNLLVYASQAARRRDDAGVSWQAVGEAYLDEWAHRQGTCDAARVVRDERTRALVEQGRLDDARVRLAAEPACDAPLSIDGLFIRAHVATDAAAAAPLLDAIAARRQGEASPQERVFLDHIEGRLRLMTAPVEGRALLRRVLADATGPEGVRARSYSYDALVEDAAARDAWPEALALFREEAGEAAPSCLLAVRRDRRIVWTAVAADGRVAGALVPDDAAGAIPPTNVLDALTGCAAVEVLARGRFHGTPQLLPADTAWHYRVLGAARSPAGAISTGARRTLLVADPRPPERLGLAALAPFEAPPPAAGEQVELLEGARATPVRVLASMAGADYVEIHAHGMLAAEGSDPSFLVLSPDERGDYALTAQAVAGTPLRRRPVVVLAACHAASTGQTQHLTWGLADSLVAAGARAVIASPGPIADRAAPRFFAAVRARIAAGDAAATALRDERATWTDPVQRAWIDTLVVFE